MKKILSCIAIAVFLLFSTNAFAVGINTYWDLNAVDVEAGTSYFPVDTTGDGVTEPFKEFTYRAQTLSFVEGLYVGAEILDLGRAYSTAITAVDGTPNDNEGLNNFAIGGGYLGYTMTFVWEDLKGEITDVATDGSIDAIYTSGTFNFYIDYNPLDFDFGGTANTFSDGVKVATVTLNSGSYHLAATPGDGSSYTLDGTFSWMLDNFWYNADTGEDLADTLVGKGWVTSYTHGDNDPLNTFLNIDPTIVDGVEYNNAVVSMHDSSFELEVVPEPSTVALMILGLFGLGITAYRKKK